MAAFIKNDSPESVALVTHIQDLVKQDPNLKTFVVFMSGPDVKPSIDKIVAQKHITIPLTFLPQGPAAADVGYYRINPAANNTVLLWNKGVVRSNFVNVTMTGWDAVSHAAQEMAK